MGGEFLAAHYPHKVIYLPTPTWANHNKIFPNAGLEVRKYRYYLPRTRLLDFEVRHMLAPFPCLYSSGKGPLSILSTEFSCHCHQPVCTIDKSPSMYPQLHQTLPFRAAFGQGLVFHSFHLPHVRVSLPCTQLLGLS